MKKLLHHELSRPSPEEAAAKPRNPLVIVVDNVRSLYNVGSIFRTCDGALVRKLYLCGYTPYPPRKEISKTSLSATESVPWEYVYDVADVLRLLKLEGMTIAALEQTSQSVSCFDIAPTHFPLAVVVGNEISGVSDAVLPYCDLAIDIPMLGAKHSLNVAVATGILCYECLRVIATEPVG
jgi:23S rRNA (guanosine2251-2'-O)-methyltransferase